MDDKKVFRDPIHSLIEFNKKEDWALLEIIQSPWFQRLRNIKQTGFVYYVYPSAHHSRFEHSLGAYAMMKKVLDTLSFPTPIEYEICYKKFKLTEKAIRRILLLAALIHDLGHGPFSHSFEYAASLNHEYILPLIIKNDLKEIINQYLSEVQVDYGAILLYDYFRRIHSKEYNQHAWLFEILSHHFDVDRLDYLLRDAYFTGVPFCSIDLPWILNNLMIKEIKGSYHLVIDVSKGTYTVEQFFYSRFNMYKQVYFHKTSRGFDLILKEFFQRAFDYFPDKLQYFLYNPIKHHRFLKNFTDRHLLYIIEYILHNTKDSVVRKLGEAILYRKPAKLLKTQRIDTEYMVLEDHIKLTAYNGKGEELLCLYKGEVMPFSRISPFLKNVVFEEERKYIIPFT